MKKNNNPNKGLFFLYNTTAGRIILRIIAKNKIVSCVVGQYMDSFLSKVLIKPFIKKHNISMKDFEDKKYKSFNDFFIRKLTNYNFDTFKDKNLFISCATSKLTCYKITDNLTFDVKNSTYTLESLIRNKDIAKKYKGGYVLVFRLSPEDYHRYCFIDDGKVITNYKINGTFHTVNPISYDKVKVFSENTRECTLLKTKHFDDVLYVEVGALLVGKIKNHNVINFNKGDEKGYFMYGGSTVILVIKKNIIKLDKKIEKNSINNIETYVKYGEKIGIKEEK